MTEQKPILCLDFDGVIHSYTSGWQGADVVKDPPVPGAALFVHDAIYHFDVQIFSSRSGQTGGIVAMQKYLHAAIAEIVDEALAAEIALFQVKWPTEKPPAMVTIDDRALTFTGEWPSMSDLLAFTPWNKRPAPDKFSAADATAESIADAMEALEQIPKSREASLVMTKLQEAQMWLSSAAPTRNEAKR